VAGIHRNAATAVNARRLATGVGGYRVAGYRSPWYGYHRSWYNGSWGGRWWRVPLFWAGYGWGTGGLGAFYNPSYGYGLGGGALAGVPSYLNYSTPIAVPTDDAAAETAPTEARDVAMQYFAEARDAFTRGMYTTATSRVERALRFLPNDPALHEFRALTLFARGRYQEATAGLYSVLAVGPGMNWATMAGLYPDTDLYTRQLRALEDTVREDPKVPYTHFLLGYHYLVLDQREAAAAEFGEAARLVPEDKLSASLYQSLTAPPPVPEDEK